RTTRVPGHKASARRRDLTAMVGATEAGRRPARRPRAEPSPERNSGTPQKRQTPPESPAASTNETDAPFWSPIRAPDRPKRQSTVLPATPRDDDASAMLSQRRSSRVGEHSVDRANFSIQGGFSSSELRATVSLTEERPHPCRRHPRRSPVFWTVGSLFLRRAGCFYRMDELKENGMPNIYGVLPVIEALRSGGRRIERLLIAEGARHERLREVFDLARQAGIPVRKEPRSALDRLASGANHQGVLALAAAARYADADSLIEAIHPGTLFVLLDGIEDPHNLGAIIRTCECAGASAVFIPERRAAHVTEVVAKTAAGATEYLPVARVTNLATLIESLKERSVWV